MCIFLILYVTNISPGNNNEILMMVNYTHFFQVQKLDSDQANHTFIMRRSSWDVNYGLNFNEYCVFHYSYNQIKLKGTYLIFTKI